MTVKKIGRVQITSTIKLWDEDINLTDVFMKPDEIQIISAVEYEGGLYLIYLYDSEEK